MPSSTKPEGTRLSAALAQSGSRFPRILAADDQQHILQALELLLKPQGYEVDVVRSPELVREALASSSYDAVLIDLNYTRDTTSGREGLDLLSEIVAIDSTLPVIVMTAWGNVELAVEAMRRGARDFIQKPWENERLLSVLRAQVELHRALQETERLTAENRLLNAQGRPDFIATAPSMMPVLETIARVAPSDANVLIAGEHGTGKEIVARTIHALSLRASRPLIAVNTGGLAEGVFESELFGHVKGAFTDARTDRIGSSRTKHVDVRVISATNADLQAACNSGQFREDLLFRLNTVEVHLPALRDRREDLPALTGHFLSHFASRYRQQIKGVDPSALRVLLQYSWPGNVRELEHAMERAVLMCRSDQIQPGDLGIGMQRSQAQNLEDLSLEAVESILIRKALQRFQGNVSQAAEALGLSRGALYRRMEKYGL